jgi:hypothetical protein
MLRQKLTATATVKTLLPTYCLPDYTSNTLTLTQVDFTFLTESQIVPQSLTILLFIIHYSLFITHL